MDAIKMKGLILRHLEQSEWVKRPQLLAHLHGLGINCSDRAMRSEIESMVTHDGHCIASNEKGYKLIRTGNELTEATHYLNAKAEAIAIRKNSLIRNFFIKFHCRRVWVQIK